LKKAGSAPPSYRGVTFLRFGPIFAGVLPERRYFHALIARFVVGVRNRKRQIQEERIVFVLLDEIQCLGRKQIV